MQVEIPCFKQNNSLCYFVAQSQKITVDFVGCYFFNEAIERWMKNEAELCSQWKRQNVLENKCTLLCVSDTRMLLCIITIASCWTATFYGTNFVELFLSSVSKKRQFSRGNCRFFLFFNFSLFCSLLFT